MADQLTGQTVLVVGEPSEFCVEVIDRSEHDCCGCGLPNYWCKTQCGQVLELCRSAIVLPN